MTWPEGLANSGRFEGRARDLMTIDAEQTRLINEVGFSATASSQRLIETLSSTPPCAGLMALHGLRVGSSFRDSLRRALAPEIANAYPLYQLLDDLAIATLISGWARVHGGGTTSQPDGVVKISMAEHRQKMEGICFGYQSGSSSLQGTEFRTHSALVPEFLNPADALGFHALPLQSNLFMRRTRRMDIWKTDVLNIDAAFQDSGYSPTLGLKGIHEYRIHVTADLHALRLLSINAEPGVLPYAECPGAVANIGSLIGLVLTDFREAVHAQLPKAQGCTHLNDALRALAEMPQLARHL